MAVLTSTGLTFSDSSVLNSKYGLIPQTTTWTFFQASAPTGWTQNTTHNDKALRVVSGTGAGSGGSIAFTSAFPTAVTPLSSGVTVSGSVGNTTIDVNTIVAHQHNTGSGENALNGGSLISAAASYTMSQAATGATGNGGAHAHPWSGSATVTSSIDLRCKYSNVIICSLN
jgi:hypothetical protein